MKKRVWIIAVLGILLIAAMFTGCSGTAKFELKDKQVQIDRYDEYVLELISGDADSIEWSSDNEQVVTVEKGKLIAQGVGEAVVTAVSGKETATVQVKVRDSGARPVISMENIIAYIDVETPLQPVIRYNSKDLQTDVNFEITLADDTYAEIVGNNIKGKAVGETLLNISAEYKGLTLNKTVSVTVRENSFVELGKTTADIYAAESEMAPLQCEIEASVVYKGEIVNAPEFIYTVESGADFIELNGNVVKAVSAGTAKIRVAYADDSTVYAIFTVVVHPNYDIEEMVYNGIYDVRYEAYSEEVGGRQGDIMLYDSGTVQNPGTAMSNCWEHHLDFKFANGQNAVEIYQRGYKYLAYDLYYTGTEQIMIGMGDTHFWAQVNSYYQRDYFKVVKDGKITNRIEKDAWVTIVYDLNALIKDNFDTYTSFFFCVDGINQIAYFMNIRYYLDDNFLPEDNGVTYEQKDGYIQASNDEFVLSAIPDDSYYCEYEEEVAGRTGVYRYKGKSDYWTDILYVRSSLGDGKQEEFETLLSRGSYLTFDIYVEHLTGLYIAFNGADPNGVNAFTLYPQDDITSYEWIRVIEGDKLSRTIEPGCWQTLCISYKDCIDYSAWSGMFYISVTGGASDVVYIDNIRYYKDDDFVPTEYIDREVEEKPNIFNTSAATIEDVGEYKGVENAYLYTNSSWFAGRLMFMDPQQYAGKYVSFKFCLEESSSLVINIHYDYYGREGKAYPSNIRFYTEDCIVPGI